MQATRDELLGAVLDGRYTVLSVLGRGGSGAVFEVERITDGQRFALKVLQRDAATHPDLVRRLRREGQVGRSLRHPGIVRCTAEGTLDDGSPYLVMERLRGESLSSLLSRVGPIGVDHACTVGQRVAGILHTVHASGYVHRDVKSEHVWLSRTSNGGLGVHLLDFGVCLAPDLEPELRSREKGRVFGTPGYVSPEQARGDDVIDRRSDLFSLGVVLFEALTGERPFQGPNVAVILRRVLEGRAPYLGALRRDVPPGVSRCIARLLDPDPVARMANARSAERALAVHIARPAESERILASLTVSGERKPGRALSAVDTPTRDLSLVRAAAR